jgi:hypothetical protein
LDEFERQYNSPLDEHAEGVIAMLCEMTGGQEGEREGEVQPEEDKKNGEDEDVDETAGAFCSSLGICRPTTSTCGDHISTSAQFSEWRVKMWDKWINM